MTKYEGDESVEASRDLARIRSLMERATEYSHLSGVSLLLAGVLALGGSIVCWIRGTDFNMPLHGRPLTHIWTSVCLLAIAQTIVITVMNARRKAEPAWNHLSRQVIAAMLPALFAGAALTGYAMETGQLDLLPPCWMLAYGSSLMGLGLFAGWRFKLLSMAFLAMGAASLFFWKSDGVVTMAVSFGGFHLLMGLWVLWKPRA